MAGFEGILSKKQLQAPLVLEKEKIGIEYSNVIV